MLDGSRAGTELEPKGERPTVGLLRSPLLPGFFPSLSLTLGAEALGVVKVINY